MVTFFAMFQKWGMPGCLCLVYPSMLSEIAHSSMGKHDAQPREFGRFHKCSAKSHVLQAMFFFSRVVETLEKKTP